MTRTLGLPHGPAPGLPLARYLLVAYALLIAYASLYPFARWAARGANPFAFLLGALPTQFTTFDALVNIAGYVPLGCLWLLATRPGAGRAGAVVAATLASAALSISLESLQSYLPDRVASNLDCILNTLGGLFGALLGAVWAPHAHATQNLLIGRHRWFRAGASTDMGLVVLGLWLFAQLTPTPMLFELGEGLGSAVGLIREVPPEPLAADVYVRLEAVSCTVHLLAVGLFAATLVQTRRSSWLVVSGLVALAMLVRTTAFATLFAPKNAFAWATPGALQGLAIGLAVLPLQRILDDRARVVIAALMLVAAIVVVSLAPSNPYTTHSLTVWRQGHFLNFYGLTSFVTTIWPLLALAYLIGRSLRARTRQGSRARPTSDSTDGDQTR